MKFIPHDYQSYCTEYTNSPLVVYTKLSPNHSGQRTHSIDRITPHCVVGQLSAESICGCFTSPTRQASCNYGIGTDGRVSLCVEEKNRSWCSSSNANDQRAVTIECASDMNEPYAMNSAVYATLIKLCTDICKRNGKKKLLWLGDKEKTLNYSPAADEMVLTVHRWFANKSCPGNWLYARMGELAATVTAALGSTSASGLQASSLKNLSEAEAVAKIGPLFTENQKQSGILACVSMAQFILKSGYGTSELAQNANNCFGMKTSLSGNTWPNSAWDGKSVYTKKTQEQNDDGSMVTITADFRKYARVEDSIADHAAYLLGAMNGSKKRYEGLAGCTDYKKAVQIIKDGGYATSHMRNCFVEAIAMCGILLYGENTEIHIAGESNMKKLAWLSVEDYATTQMELMVVSAMKGYLRRMPEQEALEKLEKVLDPKVVQMVGEDGAPMPVQSNVDGAKLAAFIDAAVADSIKELEKREDDLSKAGVTMLGNVDGKNMVKQMSPQFLEFVLDAYRSLKYRK